MEKQTHTFTAEQLQEYVAEALDIFRHFRQVDGDDEKRATADTVRQMTRPSTIKHFSEVAR